MARAGRFLAKMPKEPLVELENHGVGGNPVMRDQIRYAFTPNRTTNITKVACSSTVVAPIFHRVAADGLLHPSFGFFFQLDRVTSAGI